MLVCGTIRLDDIFTSVFFFGDCVAHRDGVLLSVRIIKIVTSVFFLGGGLRSA